MRKIVICGSMSLHDKMTEAAREVAALGFVPILPKDDDCGSADNENINAFKREVSKRHFSEIAKQDSFAILVVNAEKNGIKNYIGANAFAEIAVAFFLDKKIFLLNDLYEPFIDELSGWGAIPLNGGLNGLTDYCE